MSEFQFGEASAYGDLAKRPLPEGLSLACVPSLAAPMTRAQQLNGDALTEDQVLRIRDASTVMVVGHDEARGYVDIDAADAWQSCLPLQEAQA
jgi:hypothetical protein